MDEQAPVSNQRHPPSALPLAPSQWLMRVLSLLLAALSLTAFGAAVVMAQRPRASESAVAAALIGILILFAAIVTWRTSRHPDKRPPASPAIHWLLRIIAVGLAVCLVAGSLAFLWDVVCVFDREWLQWLPADFHPYRGNRSVSSDMTESITTGTVLGGLGSFFLWFGCRRRRGQPQSTTVHPL